MKRILLCLSLVLTTTFNIHAQSTSVNLTWMDAFGAVTPGDDKLNSSYVDASGNIYITGQISSGTDFDPSATTNSLTGFNNAYLAKYNSAGALMWAKVFTGSSTSEGRGVGVDASGNVYVVGKFDFGDINLDPSVTNFTVNSAMNDMFIAKYSSSGVFILGTSVGSNGTAMDAQGINVNGNGDVVLYGAFSPSPTVDFNPLGSAFTMTAVGSYDGFVAKYSSAFILQWAFNLGEFQNDYVYDLDVDASNNVYVAGTFQGTMDLDPSAATLTVASNGIENAFLAKYTPAGALAWGESVGGSSGDGFYRIKLDNAGSILVSGYMQSTSMDADPGAGVTTVTMVASSGQDMFLGKYATSNGAFVWAKTSGGDNTADIADITCDSQNNIYIGGYFTGTCDFDFSGSTNNVTSITTPPYNDVFIAKYNSNGSSDYIKNFGGGPNGHNLKRIVVDNNNNIVITGNHSSTVNVDFNATNNLQSFGGSDFYIIKYSQCIDAETPTLSVLSQTICANTVATLSIVGGNLNDATTWVWSSGSCGSGTIGVGTTLTVSPGFLTAYYVRGEGGCTNPGLCAAASVDVVPSQGITGTVTTSGSVPVPGLVQLFRYEGPLTKWDSITYQNVNATGIYSFNAVTSASYIIMCIPTATNLVKTYAPNNSTWKNSTIFSHGCTTDYVINISAVALATITPGPGVLAGKIVEGVNYGGRGTAVSPGNPISGLTIKGGKNPGGGIVAQGRTNGSGQYTLSGLPLSGPGETYFVFVDIPGVDTSGTHHVAITTGSTMYTEIDFVVDSDYVKPVDYTEIKELNLDGEMVKVYPNPAKDLVYVKLDSKNESNITLELYDVFGKKVLDQHVNAVQGEFKMGMDVAKLTRGIYFVRIKLNTGEARIKLILAE